MSTYTVTTVATFRDEESARAFFGEISPVRSLTSISNAISVDVTIGEAEPDSDNLTFLEAAQRSNKADIGREIVKYIREYERAGGKR